MDQRFMKAFDDFHRSHFPLFGLNRSQYELPQLKMQVLRHPSGLVSNSCLIFEIILLTQKSFLKFCFVKFRQNCKKNSTEIYNAWIWYSACHNAPLAVRVSLPSTVEDFSPTVEVFLPGSGEDWAALPSFGLNQSRQGSQPQRTSKVFSKIFYVVMCW